MIGSGCQADQESALKAECRNTIANAFPSHRGGRPNGLSKFLKRRTLVGTQSGKICAECFLAQRGCDTTLHTQSNLTVIILTPTGKPKGLNGYSRVLQVNFGSKSRVAFWSNNRGYSSLVVSLRAINPKRQLKILRSALIGNRSKEQRAAQRTSFVHCRNMGGSFAVASFPKRRFAFHLRFSNVNQVVDEKGDESQRHSENMHVPLEAIIHLTDVKMLCITGATGAKSFGQ